MSKKEPAGKKPLEIPPVPPPSEEETVAPPPPVEEEKPREKTVTIIEKIIQNLEQTYRDEKAKEANELHTALSEVIVKFKNEKKVDVRTINFVLDILKHEMVTQTLGQLEKGLDVEKVL